MDALYIRHHDDLLDIDDDQDNFVIGTRAARNRTNWLHRHDAFSQIQSAYAHHLQDSLHLHCVSIGNMFCLLQFLLLLRHIAYGRNLDVYNKLSIFSKMMIMGCLARAHLFDLDRIELTNITTVQDGDRPVFIYEPRRHRTIDSLSESNAYNWTRFTKAQLQTLALHLRIPVRVNAIVAGGRRYFSREECLIISLSKLASGDPFIRMTSMFGGDPREYSSIFRWFITHIFTTFYHKISGRSLGMWAACVDEFRLQICERINSPPSAQELAIEPDLQNLEAIYIAPESFHVFGFMDATDMRTTRTGSGPLPDGSRRIDAFELQREFYSRYFRAHGLKYLTIHLPNGLTGSVFGASLSTNDNGLINLSGVCDYLANDVLEVIPGHQQFPSLFGDAIMPLTACSQSYYRNPTPLQSYWNRRMSSARMSIEHDYALLFNIFKIMISGDHQLLRNGEHIFRIGIVCFFLKNCYVCLNGSTTNTLFSSSPPALEEYIPVDEELEPYVPAPFGENYNYG